MSSCSFGEVKTSSDAGIGIGLGDSTRRGALATFRLHRRRFRPRCWLACLRSRL